MQFNKVLTEDDVRKIAREEMLKNYRSGNPLVPRHTHDGSDNVKIKQSNIIPLITANGTINMSQATTYTLGLGNYGITPSSVTFYGGAVHSAATKQHAMIVGNAQLGINQQFQTGTATTVNIGPVVTSIIQGSAFTYINNTDLTKNVVGNSEGHILYLFNDLGTDLIVGDITSYTGSKIEITISTLAAGWTISGLWIVT